MIKDIKQLIWKLFAEIDSILKFPNLRKGEIGIQLGFDMKALTIKNCLFFDI